MDESSRKDLERSEKHSSSLYHISGKNLDSIKSFCIYCLKFCARGCNIIRFDVANSKVKSCEQFHFAFENSWH